MAFLRGTYFTAKVFGVLEEYFDWSHREMSPGLRTHLRELSNEARKRNLNEFDAAVWFFVSAAGLPWSPNQPYVGNTALLEWAKVIAPMAKSNSTRLMLDRAIEQFKGQ